jgi:hypothetical protein
MGRLAKNLKGVSIRACARALGISDTAIHKAIDAGRCVKFDDGSVDIEAVRLGMSLTADPFRGGQRHAGEFGAQLGSTVAPGAGAAQQGVAISGHSQSDHPRASCGDTPAPSSPSALLDARTKSEQAKAEQAVIELERLKGRISEIEPMARAVEDAMILVRSELQMLPDRLTPLVTPETDPVKIHATIETEVTRICNAAHEKLSAMALASQTVSA